LVELLGSDGAASITHQRVAERAGVTRATVYRHWPTTEALVIEALSQVNEPLLHFSELPFEQWLDEQLREASSAMTEPVATQTLATLLTGAIADPSIRELLDELLDRTELALARALAREPRAEDSSHENGALLAHMLGPILFRTTLQRQPVDDVFISTTVAAVLGCLESPG
jgi:AcrR family transcriptional regulator